MNDLRFDYQYGGDLSMGNTAIAYKYENIANYSTNSRCSFKDLQDLAFQVKYNKDTHTTYFVSSKEGKMWVKAVSLFNYVIGIKNANSSYGFNDSYHAISSRECKAGETEISKKYSELNTFPMSPAIRKEVYYDYQETLVESGFKLFICPNSNRSMRINCVNLTRSLDRKNGGPFRISRHVNKKENQAIFFRIERDCSISFIGELKTKSGKSLLFEFSQGPKREQGKQYLTLICPKWKKVLLKHSLKIPYIGQFNASNIGQGYFSENPDQQEHIEIAIDLDDCHATNKKKVIQLVNFIQRKERKVNTTTLLLSKLGQIYNFPDYSLDFFNRMKLTYPQAKELFGLNEFIQVLPFFDFEERLNYVFFVRKGKGIAEQLIYRVIVKWYDDVFELIEEISMSSLQFRFTTGDKPKFDIEEIRQLFPGEVHSNQSMKKVVFKFAYEFSYREQVLFKEVILSRENTENLKIEE